MLSHRTATVRLLHCGSTVSIYECVGNEFLLPRMAWLKDENEQYWLVELHGPAKLTDKLRHKRKQQPEEELFSENEQQQKLGKEQDQKSDNP